MDLNKYPVWPLDVEGALEALESLLQLALTVHKKYKEWDDAMENIELR